MQGSFRMQTAVLWSVIRDLLTIRKFLLSGPEQIFRSMGLKHTFVRMCVPPTKRIFLKSWAGFVDRTIFNEDMIYAGNLIQAGYKIAYAAEARVIHSHNYSCIQQFHRNFDLGVSQAEHPEIFESVKSEGRGNPGW